MIEGSTLPCPDVCTDEDDISGDCRRFGKRFQTHSQNQDCYERYLKSCTQSPPPPPPSTKKSKKSGNSSTLLYILGALALLVVLAAACWFGKCKCSCSCKKKPTAANFLLLSA